MQKINPKNDIPIKIKNKREIKIDALSVDGISPIYGTLGQIIK